MTFNRTLLAAAITGATLAAGSAHATNGYFKHGYGVKSMGMGGGGVAFANDNAMIIATNPAGITDVSNQVHGDLSWFAPDRGYEFETTGDLGDSVGSGDSDRDAFYIPSFGFTYALTDKDSIGLALFGNGGMNTKYPADSGNYLGFPGLEGDGGPYGDGVGGVDLQQMFITPTYARSFMEDKLSLGVSAVIVRQKFSAKGLGNFNQTGAVAEAANLPSFSVDGDNMTNKGHDESWGYGGKVGVTFKANEMLTLGASYQSKMEMDEFDDYSGLFAEGGDFDIPSTWTVGLAADVTDDVTVTFDFQRINYSDVKSISNPSTAYLTSGNPDQLLGGSDGAGFGWDDINVYKLGVQWQATPKLQLRAGWNRGDNPISSEDALFNTIAPGVVENHYTAGFSYAFSDKHEVHGAFMYAPEVDVKGDNQFLSGVAQDVFSANVQQELEINMKQYEATVGYTYKF